MTANSDRPILFVRMDRIGDLALTLPADSAFEHQVDWWIAPGLAFIADHAMPRRRVREVPMKVRFKDFQRLLAEVKKRSYQTAIVFHAPWWISALLWLARIPNRIGVRSQWHTFLFLNKAVRQKRSLAEVSEFEYNLKLLEAGLSLEENSLSREPLKLQIDPAWQSDSLKNLELKHRGYAVVHPGMGGSARNWPTSHYISWIQEAAKQQPVVVTGTASDKEILDPIQQALNGTGNVIWLNGKLTGPTLLHVLEGAKCVLVPSTGVAHLAAALGRPVIGLYSPVQVQHPKRWAPLGESVQVLVPNVECPAKKDCLGNQCAQYDCMNRISLESVREAWNKCTK